MSDANRERAERDTAEAAEYDQMRERLNRDRMAVVALIKSAGTYLSKAEISRRTKIGVSRLTTVMESSRQTLRYARTHHNLPQAGIVYIGLVDYNPAHVICGNLFVEPYSDAERMRVERERARGLQKLGWYLAGGKFYRRIGAPCDHGE